MKMEIVQCGKRVNLRQLHKSRVMKSLRGFTERQRDKKYRTKLKGNKRTLQNGLGLTNSIRRDVRDPLF